MDFQDITPDYRTFGIPSFAYHTLMESLESLFSHRRPCTAVQISQLTKGSKLEKWDFDAGYANSLSRFANRLALTKTMAGNMMISIAWLLSAMVPRGAGRDDLG